MRRRILSAFLTVMLAGPGVLYAQARLTGGDLSGTVSDASGGPVRECAIHVTNLETKVTREVDTDAKGRYQVPALAPGRYAVRATMAGFRAQVREPIDLLLGQALVVDFVLTLASSADVTVTASPLVSTGRTEVSMVIAQQQIDRLPVNGRNFIGFATMTPGVTIDRSPAQGVTVASGLSFTGQRGRSNNVMVDGFDNNDLHMGAVRATFSQEAVREFQVVTDSYSAEFGKASGGIVNIVTKSGTSQLRGNAFTFFRDQALNARSHFEKFDPAGQPVDLDKVPFRQTQTGATLGGPVSQARTFFFVSYERTAVRDARTVTIDPGVAQALSEAGFPVELGNAPLEAKNAAVFGKVDHQWSPVRSLAVRGTYAGITREGIDDFGGGVARSRGTVQRRKDWSVSAAETDVLSPRWLNEARVQFAYERQRVEALDPACGGPCRGLDQGGPTLEISGFAAVGRQRSTPQLRHATRVQVLDTVSYVAGAHQLKAGGEFTTLFFPSDANALPASFGGRYVFSPVPQLGIGSALEALERGIPAAYVQGYGTPFFPDERYADVSLFVQDEWRRGRLVTKLGVRYQRQFWQELVVEPSDVGGGRIRYALPADRNNLAPRLGLAYDLTGTGRSVLRAAYGIFFDNIVTSVEAAARIINGTDRGVRTLVLTPPLSSVAWNSPGRRLSEAEAAALLGGSYASVVVVPDPRLKSGLTHQTSIGIDRALGTQMSLSVSGLFVRGFNLPGPVDYNPVLPAVLGAGRRPNDAPCATNPSARCVNGGIPGTSASVVEFGSFGESWYRGLVLALNRPFRNGSQLLVSYTLSQAEDTIADSQSAAIPQRNGIGRNPADPLGLPLGFDPRAERGPSSADQRHRFVVSGTYPLPGLLQVSGIATAASGRPYTPLAGTDLNGDGNGGAAFPPDRARVVPGDESTSVGRNSETTAAQMNVDVRLSRRFALGSRASLDLMLEAFNVFNRTSFIEDANPSSFAIFGTGAFPANPLTSYGRYTLALPPRQLQLAAKLAF